MANEKMKILKTILFNCLLFSTLLVHGQNEQYPVLPDSISFILSIGTLSNPKIDSFHIEKYALPYYQNEVSIPEKSELFTLYYDVNGIHDSIWCLRDETGYKFNEYQLLQYKHCGIEIKSIEKPKEKLLFEIEMRGRGMSKITFENELSGKYTDSILDSRELNFSIELALFYINSGYPNRNEKYINFVDFFEAKKILSNPFNNLVTLLCFKSSNVSPITRENSEIEIGQADFRLAQFRQCLFDPKTLELMSDNIIGRYAKFYKD